MKNKSLVSLLLFMIILIGITAVADAKPVIKADTTYYDVDAGSYVLNGNVRIEVANRIITAGQAKVSLASLEVWGTDGITLEQGGIYLVADSVYVCVNQNRALINGSVAFKQPDLTITADKTDFNWRTKLGIFSGNVQVTQGNRTWSAETVIYNLNTNMLQ